MESYTGFAEVYDTFMDNVPYREWAQYIRKLLEREEIDRGLVLDLGCGTGSMTEELASYGYDMIGVDNSEEMLEIAMNKKEKSGHDILYLLQDMRQFELYGTVKAIVSVCDCINYITEEDELEQIFRLVNNYLDPGGIFIFDFNTEYKYKEILRDETIAEEREECSFIWENYYDVEEEINEYDLTIFVQTQEDLFQRFTETHLQRGYTLAQMREILQKAGLVFLKAIDVDTQGEVTEQTERICIIAREHGKRKEA